MLEFIEWFFGHSGHNAVTWPYATFMLIAGFAFGVALSRNPAKLTRKESDALREQNRKLQDERDAALLVIDLKK